MDVIGREDAIRRLTQSTAKLTVVFGDSGVGKTTVLSAARLDTRAGTVAPETVQLRNAPGALQRGLLEALGLAVAQIAVDTSAIQRLGSAIKRAAEHVAEERLTGLAKAVARNLLGVVRAHIGDEAVDVIERIAHELVTPEDATLQSQISNAADSDVVDIIAKLGFAVRELAEDSDIVLSLDNADRLGEDDLRRLADLATYLPDGIFVRVGYSTWSVRMRDAAEALRQSGAYGIYLVGFGVDQVAAYLAQAGLPEQLAAAVHAVTNGYPLYLEDAVALLKGNHGDPAILGNLQPNDILKSRTRQSWSALDAPTQTAAAMLAAFNYPLPPEDIPDYLGAPPAMWATLEARLRDAGLFTGDPRLWFHELRRRCLWDDVLTVTQRNSAADKAVPYLTKEIAANRQLPERLVEYARIAPASDQLKGTPKVDVVLAASREEIAVVASAIELAEQQEGQETPQAEHVLLHADEAFNAAGDLRPALRAAVDRGLLVAASNEYVMVVAPTLSVEALLVLAGRATLELRRTPIPAAATRLFEAVLRPRLEPFRTAIIGLGRPRIAELSDMAERLQEKHADGSYHIGPQGPNLLVRARHGGLPLYASLAYDRAEDRDRAHEQLSGLEMSTFGLPVRSDMVLDHPLDVVPSLRFPLAVERVLGSLTPVALLTARKATLPQPIDMEEEALWRAEFLAAVRAMCSAEERLAYDLEESLGFFFYEDDAGTAIAEVWGGAGARRLRSAPSIRGPFSRIELGIDAGLTRAERVGRITLRSGTFTTEDPVVSSLKRLHERAREFNKTQRKPSFALTEESLNPALASAATTRYADAQALRDVVRHGRDMPELRGESRCVLLQLDQPQPHLIPGAEALLFAVHAPNNIGRDEVVLRIVDELPKWSDPDERFLLLEDVFGETVDARQSTGWSEGVARGQLEELLGYDDHEVKFSYTDDDLAM